MPKNREFEQVKILGVEVDAIAASEAIHEIMRLSAPGQPGAYVVKPYVEFIDRANRNPKLLALLNGADMVLADGVSLQWAASFWYAGPRHFGRFISTLAAIVFRPESLAWPIPERAAGITFAIPMLKEAAAQHRRVFLVGSPKNGSIEQTAHKLSAQLPSLQIAGVASGHDPLATADQQSSTWLDNLAEQITASRADIILLGLGFPRQEYSAAYLAKQLKHGVCIGEGGTFDYEWFGGMRPKAPQAISRLGLEWLWRLALEPTRLKRQLAIPRFIFAIWKQR